MRLRCSMALLALPLTVSAQTVQPGVVTDTLECAHRVTTYQLFIPDSVRMLPAILLLHGAGGEPNDVMQPWLKLAKKKGIVLAAPVLPLERSYETVAPKVFRCVMDDVRKRATIDPARIYLFGYSMGGYLALGAGLIESEYFAGIMVYANGLHEDYYPLVDQAVRKLPVALYGGLQDTVYPIRGERRTHDYLMNHGFTIRYRELDAQDHYYWPSADWINNDAWGWISTRRPGP
ncbi:MAG TPA: hypothetical protein VMJ30_06615 [Gemmatimonadales bacterium]|nr:hypothetical protein [Gemmatimonadales bacterium]